MRCQFLEAMRTKLHTERDGHDQRKRVDVQTAVDIHSTSDEEDEDIMEEYQNTGADSRGCLNQQRISWNRDGSDRFTTAI